MKEELDLSYADTRAENILGRGQADTGLRWNFCKGRVLHVFDIYASLPDMWRQPLLCEAFLSWMDRRV
jgi:hypothetical protein